MATELRHAIGRLSQPAQRFLSTAADQPDISEMRMRETLSVTDEQLAELTREIDGLLTELTSDADARRA